MNFAFANNKWNEAFLDCLHIIMKLLVYYLIDNNQVLIEQQQQSQKNNCEQIETPRKRTKRNNNNNNLGSSSSVNSNCSNESTLIKVSLTKSMNGTSFILNDLVANDVELFINLILNLQTIISSSDYVYLANKNMIKIEILYYSMQLLSSCLLSVETSDICTKFCSNALRKQRVLWVKALLLDCQEALFRKEVCSWLYKLATATSNHSQASAETASHILIVILCDLLSILHIASKFSPNITYSRNKKDLLNTSATYGLTCKDYFFLLTSLIQNLSSFNELAQFKDDVELANIENIIKFNANQLKERDFFEINYNNDEDEVLIGLLNLGIVIMKHSPNYKSFTKSFIDDLYGYLFELPSSDRRYLPKCKSSNSRTLCFDLLIELVRNNIDNYKYLHNLLLTQHQSMSHSPYAWDYWPRDDVRSTCGYAGLTNLGATCYMATCMQHLYMINEARVKILKAQVSDDGKRYENMLTELQKMFAYLLESSIQLNKKI